MKRRLSILLTLILALALILSVCMVGCKGGKDDKDNDKEETATDMGIMKGVDAKDAQAVIDALTKAQAKYNYTMKQTTDYGDMVMVATIKYNKDAFSMSVTGSDDDGEMAAARQGELTREYWQRGDVWEYTDEKDGFDAYIANKAYEFSNVDFILMEAELTYDEEKKALVDTITVDGTNVDYEVKVIPNGVEINLNVKDADYTMSEKFVFNDFGKTKVDIPKDAVEEKPIV